MRPLVLVVILFASFLVLKFYYEGDTKESNSAQVSYTISSKWDDTTTCQTTIVLLKNANPNKKDSYNKLHDLPCTVAKLSAPLPGKFAGKTPYSVSWTNGQAARVFVAPDGLRMSGYANDGVPSSW